MTDREVISLKEYIDSQIQSILCLSESKIEALEKATILAKETLDKRLDSINEFRDSLKTEYETLSKEVESLKLSRAELQGKANQSAVNVSYLISGLAIFISVIAIIIRILLKI